MTIIIRRIKLFENNIDKINQEEYKVILYHFTVLNN